VIKFIAKIYNLNILVDFCFTIYVFMHKCTKLESGRFLLYLLKSTFYEEKEVSWKLDLSIFSWLIFSSVSLG